ASNAARFESVSELCKSAAARAGGGTARGIGSRPVDALRTCEANDAVLAYLENEQLPSWRTSDSPWIKDGYALETHPDLCEFLASIDDRAGAKTTFRYLYGKPALIAKNDVVVAFAQGTHIVCLRLPRDGCDAEFIYAR